MRQQLNVRHLAALLFPLSTYALPEPQVGGGGPGRGGNPAPAPVLPWVTVDPIGLATTITPSVFTTNGVRTTANLPPDELTSTATYTLSPGGTDRPDLASTYTGLAPVASATGTSDEGGAFLACNRGQGTDEPFCLPKRGSILHPGRTYYVTWSTSYFAPPNVSIALQTWYNPQTEGFLGGFTTNYFPASVGFYAWSLPSDFLTSSTNETIPSLNISLSLVYEDTETADPNDIKVLRGPAVLVVLESEVPKDSNHGSDPGDKSYAAAIAVPIIVVILLIGLGGLCFFKWKRNGVLPVPTFGRRRSVAGGAGYGERQSRAQRVGSGSFGAATNDKQGAQANTFGIQLTDRESWSPTTGRNVFREEIQRQEAAAQRH